MNQRALLDRIIFELEALERVVKEEPDGSLPSGFERVIGNALNEITSA